MMILGPSRAALGSFSIKCALKEAEQPGDRFGLAGGADPMRKDVLA